MAGLLASAQGFVKACSPGGGAQGNSLVSQLKELSDREHAMISGFGPKGCEDSGIAALEARSHVVPFHSRATFSASPSLGNRMNVGDGETSMKRKEWPFKMTRGGAPSIGRKRPSGPRPGKRFTSQYSPAPKPPPLTTDEIIDRAAEVVAMRDAFRRSRASTGAMPWSRSTPLWTLQAKRIGPNQ